MLQALRLHQRFASSESFMYFAEGLRAMRSYRARLQVRDLGDSLAAFRDGITAYPGEPLLHYYFALVCLEMAAVDEEKHDEEKCRASTEGAYADEAKTTRREGLIIDALLHFERYQEEKAKESARNGERWLVLWCEYNRAAAQVHRLRPAGYLRARGILLKYLRLGPDSAPADMKVVADIAVAHGSLDSEFHLSHAFLSLPTIAQSAGKWLSDVARLQKPSVRQMLPSKVADVLVGTDPQEWRALLLQMESLLLITRSRPLREPECLRRRGCEEDDVGLEDPERVERALGAFYGRVTQAFEESRISQSACRDLTSDVWSQRGHLCCARALQAVKQTSDSIRERWSDLERPLNNRSAFALLLAGADDDARKWLQQASVCFRTALTHQPRWMPATKNLEEVEALLRKRRPRVRRPPPSGPV